MIRAREDRWFDRFRRTGDPRLLAKVFDRTAPELWRVAAHLCRDRHAAEDAVQGTFLVAIEAQDDWDAARPLLPWLLGLLANRVREHRRREAREIDRARLTEARGEGDPAEVAGYGEFGAAFRTALERLEEPFRSTLERHLVHGTAAHDLAAELGVPAGTVRMRLHRGLEQLRRRLPQGFAMSGAVALRMPPESFAAMRQVVLAEVPGGAAVAAVGSGHVVAGVIGVLLMKKTMLVVVACLVLGLGLWSAWPEPGGALASGPQPAAKVVATHVRPIAPPASDAVPEVPAGGERTAARPTAPSAAKGQLRVVLRHGGTGEGVALNLEILGGLAPAGAPGVQRAGDMQFGTTDGQGVAVFTLPPGRAQVRSSILLREPVEAEVVANAETELTVELPVRLAAEVEVVDAAGRPLAGARILGRTHGDVGYYVERELGRTGADGHWRAEFLDEGIEVRATCDGHVASAQANLQSRQPRTRFVLADGPAVVEGTVYGSDGRPLPGALVAIQQRLAGVAGEAPLALVADASGRFTSAHVRPGEITVFASRRLDAGSFVTARTDLVVQAGGPQQADVRFGGGASLTVTLLGPDGRPVVDHEVTAVWRPEREVHVHLSSLASGRGKTDAQGVCVFPELLPGDYEVQAYDSSWTKAEKITLTAGQPQHLVWSLRAPVDVEVQLVGDAREPLAGWQVELSPGVGTVREARTDRKGVVRFEKVPDLPYQAVVRQRVGLPESLRTGVQPGQRNVLVVGAARLATAAVRGVVQLPAGTSLADVRAELQPAERRGETMRQVLRAPEGTFRFEGLTAGVYELAFRRENDREYLAIPQRVEVAAGADTDLGTVVLQLPADVRIDVLCADGGRVRDLFAGAAAPDRPRTFGTPRTAVDANGVTLLGIPAGRFEVLVWGADIAPVFVPAAVAGAPVQLAVTAPRAVATTFRFVGLPAARAESMVVYLQNGAELLRERFRDGAWVRGFVPGRYRIEVAGGDGVPGAAAEFTVGTAAGPDVEVHFAK